MRSLFYSLILLLLCLISCNYRQENTTVKSKPGKKELADINSYFVQKDRSGLWYYIVNDGSGKLFGNKDKIVFDYTCSLLDGTLCYSSEKLGQKVCVLGKTEIEPGLNEGLRLLRPGSEAVFILPPFLAYGLLGDGKSIPARAIIIYRIKINK